MLLQTATLLALCVGLDRLTSSWARRRIAAVAAVAVVGYLSVGAPVGAAMGGWVAAGLVSAAALAVLYVGLIRFDLSMLPLAIGVSAAVEAIGEAVQHPFP